MVDRIWQARHPRQSGGSTALGPLGVSDILVLPEDESPPPAEVNILYKSAVATAHVLFSTLAVSERLDAAHELVGTIAVKLTRNRDAYVELIRMMRRDSSVYATP